LLEVRLFNVLNVTRVNQLITKSVITLINLMIILNGRGFKSHQLLISIYIIYI